ncbi:ABC transporter, permease protein [gut metagenome]|uniref:ABC transporter, permease protein n=1 Tax=gut metagenome TaxID=749906 RepID=J9G6F8_9ZZZZ
MIVLFLTPAVLTFCIMFLYPVSRTVIMSLFSVKNVTDPVSSWQFVGLQNFIDTISNVVLSAFHVKYPAYLAGGWCCNTLDQLAVCGNPDKWD